MWLLPTWIPRNVTFGSKRGRSGMLEQERPGPRPGWEEAGIVFCSLPS